MPRNAFSAAKLTYFLIALAAFFGGLLLYALFRNIDNMLIFRFMAKPAFLVPEHFTVNTATPLGYFFKFNLLHGLWALSALMLIRLLFAAKEKTRRVYAGAFLGAACLLELMQLTKIVPGTFDPLDLASYGIFAFVEGLTYKFFFKRRFS
jgi:hypothetical protein